MSYEPVRIRGRAPRVLPRVHAISALALLVGTGATAAAEEPKSRCDACPTTPSQAPPAPSAPPAPTTAPAEQKVSEASSSKAQGVAAPNVEAQGEPKQAGELKPRIEVPPAVPVQAPPPLPPLASTASTASVSPSPPTSLLGVRLPAFIAFGIGSLGAGGAVVTHLAAAAPYTDPKLGCNGRCADGSHTLGMTSTILAGLAVGAVGTGIVLVLSEPSREKKPLAPVLKMSVSPSKASASASWAF